MQVVPEGAQEGEVQKDEGGSHSKQMGDGRDAAFFASELCTESGEHHADAADVPCAVPEPPLAVWRLSRQKLVSST